MRSRFLALTAVFCAALGLVTAGATAASAASPTSIELSATPAVSGAGDEIVLTATVSGDAPTGQVNFFAGALLLGTSPLDSSGIASLPISTLGAGTHTITAQYEGDDANDPSTSDGQLIEVSQAAASVTFTSTPSGAALGESVTLTVQVTGFAPTGSVEFTTNTGSLGSSPLDAAGIAALTVDVLPVGASEITANYSGDANNLAASSTPTTLTISRALAAITLTANANPATFGSLVTLTATITGLSPTGTVEFYLGSALQGVGAVNSSGSATFNLATLPVGEHSLSAVYLGDANHETATSAILLMRISPFVNIPEEPLHPDPPLTVDDETGTGDTAEELLAETGGSAETLLAALAAAALMLGGVAALATRNRLPGGRSRY